MSLFARTGGSSGTSSRWRRSLAAVAAATVAFTSAVAVGNLATAPEAAAIPPFPIKDSGSGTAGQLNTNWVRSTSGPGNTGGQYTSDGWTRLTNANLGQSTNLLNNTAFDSTTGFQVEFDYRQSGGVGYRDNINTPYRTADGISMYLVDGSVTGGAGAAGSGLGYAGGESGIGNTCTPGIPKGYLGLGLDVFGNYSTARTGAYVDTTKFPASVDYSSSVALRGSGGWGGGNSCSDAATSRYPLIASQKAAGLWTDTRASAGAIAGSDPASQATSLYRRAKVTVLPSGSSVKITAEMTPAAAKNVSTGGFTQVFSTTVPTGGALRALPAQLKLGFAASTGGASDYHDIRNISVRALTDLSLTSKIDVAGTQPAGAYKPGDPVQYSFTAKNEGPTTIGNAPAGVAKVYHVPNTTALAGVSWTCASTTGATCLAPSGTGPVDLKWTGPKDSTVTITVKGTAKAVSGTYAAAGVIPTAHGDASDVWGSNTVGPDNSPIQEDLATSDTNTANNSSSVNYTIVTPNFTQTKTVDKTTYAPGQPATYVVEVSNTGNMTGKANITDTVPASVLAQSISCSTTAGGSCDAQNLSGQNATASVTLPAGGKATITIKGTAGAAGSAQNSATITPTTPGCEVAGSTCGGGTATTPASTVLSAGIDLTQVVTDKATGAAPTNLVAGQKLVYTYTVTNTGQYALGSYNITQGKAAGDVSGLPAPTCSPASLAAGASATCTVEYTVTQADVDAGKVTNTASVTGTPQGGGTAVNSPDRSTTATGTRTPGLSITSTAKPADGQSTVDSTSDSVTYEYVLTNTGNVTITGAGVSLPQFSGSPAPTVTCPTTTIKPGESVTCTATYPVSQKDLDAGSITQTAKGTGTTTAGAVTANAAQTTVPVKANAALTSTLDVAPGTYDTVGQKLTYTVKVTNSGNVTVDGLSVDKGTFTGDAAGLSAPSCDATKLAPNASTTCTYTYTVTQADLDRGSIVDHASVKGTGANGAAVQSAEDDATATTKENAKLTASASMNVPTGAKAGTSVPVTFTVTNGSNVSLNKVGVDASVTTGTGSLSGVTCTPTTLAPGQSATCTANYTLTQADIDRGTVAVSGTAQGTTPSNTVVKADAAATATGSVPQAPELTTTGKLSSTEFQKAGDTLTFTVTSKNTGNTSLTGVSTDLKDFTGDPSKLSKTCTPTGASVTLAPGESVECVYTYAVTQADVDRGSVAGTPTSSGKAPGGAAVTDEDATLTATAKSTSQTKTTVTAGPSEYKNVGDTVTFTLTVENTGSTTLKDPALSPTGFTGSEALGALQCDTTTTLAPGEKYTCTVRYTVTQADLDRGTVELSASSSAKDPAAKDVTSQGGPAEATATLDSSIGVTMTSDTTQLTGAGQVVTYTVTSTNTGNSTLTKAALNPDSFSGTGTPTVSNCTTASGAVTNGDATLAPGETMTCTVSYTVTQADMDAGKLDLVMRADGTDPAAKKVSAKTSDSEAGASIPVSASPELRVTKTADQAVISAKGDKVTYTITVANVGNQTVNKITLADTGFTGSAPLGALECATDNGTLSLAPGQSANCTVEYTASQADVDSQGLSNSAKATGQDPTGDPVTDSSDNPTVVPSQHASAIDVVKSSNVSQVAAQGDTISYTLTATNIGNTTLKNVDLSDTGFTGSGTLGDPSCAVGAQTATNGAVTLAPNQSVSCTITYTVTQADLDSGALKNGAKVSATDPDDKPVEDTTTSTTTVTATDEPGLQISGAASTSSATQAGQKVTYTFTVTNSGNRTISGAELALKDGTGQGQMGQIVCKDGNNGELSLAPGASTTCTVEYTVSQADIDAKDFQLSAEVTGTTPGGGQASAALPGPIVVDTPDAPALSQTSVPSTTVVNQAGDKVTYTVTTKNTGNTTLNAVNVKDAAVTGDGELLAGTCTQGGTEVSNGSVSLAPDEEVVCTYTYTVTQNDMNGTGLTFTAGADGTSPADATVTAASTAETVLPLLRSSLAVSKVASNNQVVKAGDTVTYTIKGTNTGNSTLRSVNLTDTGFTGDRAALVLQECTANGAAAPAGGATLQPGESVECVYVYTTNQGDLDRGDLRNRASGTGTDPANGAVTTTTATDTVVDLSGTSALKVEKTSNPGSVKAAGDKVTYTITAQNTGTRTLTDVLVEDIDFNGTGQLDALSCSVAGTDVTNSKVTLAPGATVTCVVTYTVTQADMNGAGLTNSAKAEGKNPDGDPVSDQTDAETSTSIDSASALGVAISTDTKELTQKGQKIDYTITLTDNGNTTLKDVTGAPSDLVGTGDLSALTCLLNGAGDPVKDNTTTLQPGESLVCTVTYTATQADVDSEKVSLSATGESKDPSGAAVKGQGGPAEVPTAQSPRLETTKTSDVNKVAKAGDEITYTIATKNTGNVSITAVSVKDADFTGTGQLKEGACTLGGEKATNGEATLAPGQSLECVFTYVVTQADVDAGTLSNGATGSGTDPKGEPVVDPTDTPTVITPSLSPAIKASVSASPSEVAKAGDQVTLTFTAKNTGNTTLNSVSVLPEGFTGNGDPLTLICVDANGDTHESGSLSLAPGESAVCTAVYTVTQADIDQGSLTVGSTDTGVSPQGTTVKDTAAAEANLISVKQSPSIKVSKSVDLLGEQKVNAAGQQLLYRVVAENTGNTTLRDVNVADTDFTGKGTLGAADCRVDGASVVNGSITLAPGQRVECTFSYTVVQADLDGAGLSNAAKATGQAPGKEVEDTTDEPTVTPMDQRSSMTVTKTVDTGADGKLTAPGQKLSYTITTKNTGTTTLTKVGVSDTEFSGSGKLTVESCSSPAGDVANGEGTLAPGESMSCTYSYIVTQADMNGAGVSNSARADAQDPNDKPVEATTDGPTSAPTDGKPELKTTAVVDTTEIVSAGQPVTYTVTVTNTGNQTVSAVGVSPSDFTGHGTLGTFECTVDGESVDNGAGVLNAGQSMTCTVTYTTTQEDVDGKDVTLNISAQGTDPAGEKVYSSIPEPIVVPTKHEPSLAVVKGASVGSVSKAGDVVTYTITATNTGNVTATKVTVDDADFSGSAGLEALSCAVEGDAVTNGDVTLAPDQSVSCVVSYTVTQADIDGGDLKNSARVNGQDPDNQPIPTATTPEPTTVSTDGVPGLQVVKNASRASVTAAGQSIDYTITATNTGSYTLKNVVVKDVDFNGTGTLKELSCTVDGASVEQGKFSLKPGQSVTCVVTYTVTQADVDGKELVNSASVSGEDKSGKVTTIETEEPTTVTSEAKPALTVTKTVDPTSFATAGDTVRYQITAVNSGQRTLHDVSVADTGFTGAGKLVAKGCTVGADEAQNGSVTLAPGESVACSFEYTVLQADVDGNGLSNGAKANGTDPAGEPVEDSTDQPTTSTPDRQPELTSTMVADHTSVDAPGTDVIFTNTVRNTGNTTVTGITISPKDPALSGTLGDAVCTVDGKPVKKGEITLAPGQEVVCTFGYTTTQQDVDGPGLKLSGTATGTAPGDTPVSDDSAPAEVPSVHAPQLTTSKVSSLATISAAGEQVEYTITVKNTGNTTVGSVNAEDKDFNGTGGTPSFTCQVDGQDAQNGSATLAPGQELVCKGTYTVTQADVNGSGLSNSAVGRGTDTDNEPVEDPTDGPATVPSDRAPKLTTSKSVDTDKVTQAGQVITYTITVENTGNVTASGVSASDTDFTGKGTLSAPRCDKVAGETQAAQNGQATLDPGQKLVCVYTYTVVQADLDGAGLSNAALGSGTDTTGEPVEDPTDKPTTTPIEHQPSVATAITVNPNTIDAANQATPFTITVTNTGNTTLKNLSAKGVEFDGNGTVGALTFPQQRKARAALSETGAGSIASLAPGQTVTGTVAYTSVQADVDQGRYEMSSAVEGESAFDAAAVAAHSPEPAVVTAVQQPALSVVKSADVSSYDAVGDRLTYTITVTNTGNVTMKDITVADTGFTGTGTLEDLVCTQDQGAMVLAPGEQASCTVTYAATQDDVDAANLSNSAQATGSDPNDTPLTATTADETAVPSVRKPSVDATITSPDTNVGKAGDTVQYTVTVSNNGNTTLTGVKPGPFGTTGTGELGEYSCTLNGESVSAEGVTLKPGEELVCTITYTAT